MRPFDMAYCSRSFPVVQYLLFICPRSSRGHGPCPREDRGQKSFELDDDYLICDNCHGRKLKGEGHDERTSGFLVSPEDFSPHPMSERSTTPTSARTSPRKLRRLKHRERMTWPRSWNDSSRKPRSARSRPASQAMHLPRRILRNS